MSHPLCSHGGVKNKNPNPDHNIWNNNGTYWCHYTVHHDDYTKQRVRVSLRTNDVQIARALRDFLMEATPKIATNIPRLRGQAMPDSLPEVSESRAVSPRKEYLEKMAATHE
jgi:spore germination protein GerM